MTEPEQTLTDRVVNIHTKRLGVGIAFIGAVAGSALAIHRYEIIEEVIAWVLIITTGVVVSYLVGAMLLEDYD